MPVPDDLLIIDAGFHAAQGTRLEPLDEDFYFRAPEGRRFSIHQKESSKKPVYYLITIFLNMLISNFR